MKPAVAPGTALTGWRAFSVDGEVVGELILPTDATLLDATSDRVLLLRRSDLDEESLEVRNLTSPPR